ncbi:hypothetical protein [Bacillus benzoevorans]|uniref:Uncharacterized protein n=1 Tax=Bacillus benzoevorans TaxID=1456 RepID=A0A7X0HQK9_9BACI|nr:hypothetical protein [Bacillus benzoevorans]MBB6443810.1 hypothetical protein [Bacillus benzoevorans]
MEEKVAFLQLLKPVRKQLWTALFVCEFQLYFLFLGVWLACILLLSRIIVIPFPLHYSILGAAALMGLLLFRIWRKRPDDYDAVLLFNRFVADDRVVTAYSFIGKGGLMETLQLQDAVKHMKRKQEEVLQRRKKHLEKRMLLWSALLFAGCAILFILPNENSDLAKKRENDIKLVNKAEKELKEKLKQEKDEGVKKSLEEAKEKVAQSKTAEEALTNLAKQMKELELKVLKEKEKQEVLKDWQDSLNESGINQLAELLAKKDLRKIEKELAKLNGQWEKLPEKQKEAMQSFTGQEQQLSAEELERIVKTIEEALQSEDILADLARAKTAIESSGQALQQQLAANGTPPEKLAFSSGNGGKPSGNKSNGNGQTGVENSVSSQGKSSTGANQSGSNAAGNGTGSGNGSGSGSGSGAGSGGGGTGSGNGSGAGLGEGPRGFLTIPEKTTGKENREIDGGQLGEGAAAEQTEGSGPVMKGTVRPYEEVYGEYEESYRESSDRYKLPANLEKIVQNYFTNIDPNGE